MKVYINKETGITIETESELSGDWELLQAPEKPKKPKKVEVEEVEPEK